MIAIYSIYLFFFPLPSNIDPAERVSDIEILLRDGRKWFALFYVLGLGALFFAYWRVLKIVHALPKGKPETEKFLSLWVLGIGIVCGLLLIRLYPITAGSGSCATWLTVPWTFGIPIIGPLVRLRRDLQALDNTLSL